MDALEVDSVLQTALSGRYTLVRPLGRGGMGSVYLGRDEAEDRYVAVKVLHPELAAELSTGRFSREVALLRRLKHPSVVSVLDSGTDGGFAWFAMPLIQGESLRERLRREERLRFADIQTIASDVGAGLDHVHQAAVVHRDLKPENILLAGGHALVADFGIARALQDTAELSATMTRTGQLLGTPAYMSPEQVSGTAVDARSDVYSFGAVVYEMLVGEPPFHAPTAVQLMALHLTDPPIPPRHKLEDVPPEMDGAVLQALAKEPERRFASAGEFAAALCQPLGARALAARATTRPIVAVLDFVNLVDDAGLGWLGTGLAETLSAALSRMEGIRLVPRDRLVKSVVQPPGLRDEQGAISVARAVGARWVVWGAFQGLGGELRIHYRLADVATGMVRPAETLSGSMGRLFWLQDQLLDAVKAGLAVVTPTATLSAVIVPAPGALTAYEHYIRGLQQFRKFGPRGFSEAWEHLERAVQADPRHAPALASMGGISVLRFVGTSKESDLEQGVQLLERALAVDPLQGEAYLWLGYAYLRRQRFDEATRFARRATELEPGNALAHYIHGFAMLAHGMEEHRWELFTPVVLALVRAIQLDPAYNASYFGLGALYLQSGQYAEAAPLLERALLLDRWGPGGKVRLPGATALLGAARRRAGELAEARALQEEAVTTLEADEHYYAPTFTALAQCELGMLTELAGAPDEALGHYLVAGALCEARKERLGTARFWIRAKLGLARCQRRLGRPEADASLGQARAALASGSGRRWGYVWEGGDALLEFELAYTHLVLGSPGEASAALRRAVDRGWGDWASLEQIRATAPGLDPDALESLRSFIESRGALPGYPPTLLVDTEAVLRKPAG